MQLKHVCLVSKSDYFSWSKLLSVMSAIAAQAQFIKNYLTQKNNLSDLKLNFSLHNEKDDVSANQCYLTHIVGFPQIWLKICLSESRVQRWEDFEKDATWVGTRWRWAGHWHRSSEAPRPPPLHQCLSSRTMATGSRLHQTGHLTSCHTHQPLPADPHTSLNPPSMIQFNPTLWLSWDCTFETFIDSL